ncbi:MAG: transcriptional regulator NrdR [Candidatus Omnitrophica bacterium]|nr:transcriptional regulator NrdR [Candidatus Omnitrophota bacterium]
MRCAACGHKEDKVVDSRSIQDDRAIRRRRECLRCGRRFTTYEYIEEPALMVIKRDGRRQPFDRKKILAGIMKACEKRSISMEQMEDIVIQVERTLQKKPLREVTSTRIGELVMEKLKELDEVAYVRFASVYRSFRDVEQFMEELKAMLDKERKNNKSKKDKRYKRG